MPTPTAPVAVVGASGGLGASTLALAVGRRLAATGPPAVVVDLDTARGGLDVTAGVEHLAGRRWPAFAALRGGVAAELVLGSLPREDGCRVLSAGGPSPGAVPDRAVRDVLDSLAGGPERTVLDLPAASPALAAALAHHPLVLVLTSLRTRGLADADALVERLVTAAEDAGTRPDLRLVTRGGRAEADVVDDVVAHLGIAHLAHLADDDRVPRDAERGLWPGTGRDAVRRVADAVVELVDARAEAS
jgi:septum formation inhibitor-activating ATPase MinD